MVENFCSKSKSRQELSREEEYELITQIKEGSNRALRQLIGVYRKIITSSTYRYGAEVDHSALICAGEHAVSITAENFDLSTGNRFNTYFYSVLQTQLKKRYCDEAGISPVYLDHLCKINKATTLLKEDLGREPTEEELGAATDLSALQVRNALDVKNFSYHASLDLLIEDDLGIALLDTQVDARSDTWDRVEASEKLSLLQRLEANGNLEQRQITAFVHRSQGYSAQEIGDMIGTGAERVRQLLKGIAVVVQQFTEGLIILSAKEPETPLALVPEAIAAVKPVLVPVLKRVDATRLGGRIGRFVQRITEPVGAALSAVSTPLFSDGPVKVSGLISRANPVSICKKLAPVSSSSEPLEGDWKETSNHPFILWLSLALVYLSTTVDCLREKTGNRLRRFTRGPTFEDKSILLSKHPSSSNRSIPKC